MIFKKVLFILFFPLQKSKRTLKKSLKNGGEDILKIWKSLGNSDLNLLTLLQYYIKSYTSSPWQDILKYESCLGILIWIFLHQVLVYHDVSMRAYNRISHCTWFYIAAIWYMLDVVAYICNYTYKFLDATLFMLDVRALAYSDTYP